MRWLQESVLMRFLAISSELQLESQGASSQTVDGQGAEAAEPFKTKLHKALIVSRPTEDGLKKLKDAGFDAMMFHDDDAVPEIDDKSEAQIRNYMIQSVTSDALIAAFTKSLAMQAKVQETQKQIAEVEKQRPNKKPRPTRARAKRSVAR